MNILEVSTKTGCQINCGYCPQKTHIANYTQKSDEFMMSLETFKACIDHCPPEIEIQFAGYAEPWLNPHCTEMLLYAHETGHKVAVFTTCVGMNVDDVQKICDLPYHHFCLHLPDDAGQMKVNMTPDYIRTVLMCLQRIPAVSLMCVGNLHPSLKTGLKRSVKDWTKALVSRAGTVEKIKTPEYKSGPLKKLDCMFHGVLLPNGDVQLCCMDYGVRHTLGSLKTTSHREIYKSDAFQQILLALKDESIDIICRKCEIAEREK